MSTFIAVLLAVAGGIHLLPITGVLGAKRLTALYGVDCDEPNLAVLMRHRAVLLGIVGGILVGGGLDARLQPWALAVGWVSVLSFLVLARPAHALNAKVRRVVAADLVALACLVVATVGYTLLQIG